MKCVCGAVFDPVEAKGPSKCLARNVTENRAEAMGKRMGVPCIRASDVADCGNPDWYAIALADEAREILMRLPGHTTGRECAMWRLFDATIRIAEALGSKHVSSGLADANRWTMRKGGVR